jgi:hypothetical protein
MLLGHTLGLNLSTVRSCSIVHLSRARLSVEQELNHNRDYR